MSSTGSAAIVGLATVVAFAGIVVLLPLLKPGFDPVEHAISHGAIGDFGWLQSTAFLGLGLGSLAIAWAIRHATPSRGGRTGAGFIAAWGVLMVLAGLFTADAAVPPETTAGRIHSAVSILGFVCILAGMSITSFAFRSDPVWRRRFALSITLFALGVLGLIATVATRTTEFWGAVQRPFVAILLAWLVWISVILMRAPGPTWQGSASAPREA